MILRKCFEVIVCYQAPGLVMVTGGRKHRAQSCPRAQGGFTLTAIRREAELKRIRLRLFLHHRESARTRIVR